MKTKESQELRKLRLQISNTKTRIVPDKTKYNRKRAKSKKDWPAFLLRRTLCQITQAGTK